ncbi:MAG: hypothetical protein JJ892_12290 [Balneola sp.]|nr:hypothetical protein [Balneola sp.]MBO6652054.1 hypothetical protein [Balneola sp.]MBO6712459.1 hypothetical protein [Balneola sp.]MBO6801048.1 hypothetical protein [Balneola sp.]MBO6870720.1 hypothetical protein [Balneola sp.]
MEELRRILEAIEKHENEDLKQELYLELQNLISDMLSKLISENENYYSNEIFITALKANPSIN